MNSFLVKAENIFLKKYLIVIVLIYYSQIFLAPLYLKPFKQYLTDHGIITGILGFTVFLIIPAIIITLKNKSLWFIIDEYHITLAKKFSQYTLKQYTQKEIYAIQTTLYKHDGIIGLGTTQPNRRAQFERILLPPVFELKVTLKKENTDDYLTNGKTLLSIITKLYQCHYISLEQKNRITAEVENELKRLRTRRIIFLTIVSIFILYGFFDYFYIHYIF